ncbi:MAG TPA: hypothetical protein VMT11_04795 [Myxococcaceae bacterium]|nr:hypothetical protein [Myxococcaceae bacterium]
MTRSTFPLIYQGLSCVHHRCAERLVDTNECVECVGPVRLRQMEERSERQSMERRMHRVLHEMSDGGKTILQLVHTTGLSTTQLRPLLEQLAAAGLVRFGEERFGHHSRWLWSLLPAPAPSRGHEALRSTARPLGAGRVAPQAQRRSSCR